MKKCGWFDIQPWPYFMYKVNLCVDLTKEFHIKWVFILFENKCNTKSSYYCFVCLKCIIWEYNIDGMMIGSWRKIKQFTTLFQVHAYPFRQIKPTFTNNTFFENTSTFESIILLMYEVFLLFSNDSGLINWRNRPS